MPKYDVIDMDQFIFDLDLLHRKVALAKAALWKKESNPILPGSVFTLS
jgi:hypothetical protein